MLSEKLAFLAFTCICFACENNSQTVIISEKEFEEVYDLSGKAVALENTLLLPTHIFKVHENVIVFDNDDNALFKVYGIPELDYKFSWGKRGEGPGEIKMFDPSSFEVVEDGFEYQDMFNIRKCQVLEDTIKTVESKKLPLFDQPLNRVRKINDTLYFADNQIGDKSNEHVALGLGSNSILYKFGDYPTPSRKLGDSQISMAFMKNNVANFEKERFVTFYQKINKVKFYDLEGNLIKELKNGSYDDNQKAVIHYAEPVATENFIYVFNIKKSKKEIEEDIENYKPTVEVWDWSGNPIASLNMDKPIISMAIDEEARKIYGVSFWSQSVIYEFDLPQIRMTNPTNKKKLRTVNTDEYSLMLFDEWEFISSTADSMDFEGKKFLYSRDIYGGDFESENKCGSSLWVSRIFKADKEVYLRMLKSKYQKLEDYDFSFMVAGNKQCDQISFEHHSTDPRGVKTKNNGRIWVFQAGEDLCEVRLYSCDYFDKYVVSMENILTHLIENNI
jgi:hypothetical protein